MKKKTLSLLLVLAMVLGSFSFAFAAEEPAAMTEAEAGEFLKKAGVLEGNDAGDLMLDKALKRQDMVVLFSRLLGQEEEAKTFDGQPTFKDIRDKYYNPYLAWGQANKLIEGHTEERFGYNEEMTAQQYVTILLRALGYGEEAKDYDNVVAKAKELGLLKDVKVEKDTKITRGQMSVMTMNALGTNLKGEEKTLADKLNIELPAPPEATKVEKVYADNLKEIVVKFDGEVDETSAEDVTNYAISGKEIEAAELSEDLTTVVLTLKDKMENQKEYTLTIVGVKAGNKKITDKIKFAPLDNTLPEVVEVKSLGTKAIKVIASEPIKNANAQNFKLDGKSYFGTVAVDGRTITLKPYNSTTVLKPGDHELTVSRIEDFNTLKSLTQVLNFAVVEDNDAPQVVEVNATLEKAIVIFDEDIDPVSASKYNFYWKSGNVKKYPNSVVVSGNKAILEFETDKLPAYETKLYVVNVVDYSGNKMAETEVVLNATVDQTRPEVVDVKVSDDAMSITVKFSKNVNAGNKAYYTVKDQKGKVVPVKNVTGSGKVFSVVLYKALPEGVNTLTIEGVADTTTLKNVMLPFSTELEVGDSEAPEVSAVSANSTTRQIIITFSEDMDLASIADPTNYLILVGNSWMRLPSGTEINPLQNGRAVLIILPEKINNKVVTFKDPTEDQVLVSKIQIMGAMDLAENPIQLKAGKNPADLTLAVADAKPVDFANRAGYQALFVDANTIKVRFDQAIGQASKDAFTVTGRSIETVEYDGTNIVVIKLAEVNDDITTIDKDAVKIADGSKIKTVTGNKAANGATIKTYDLVAPVIVDKKATLVQSTDGKSVLVKVKFSEPLNSEDITNYAHDLVVTRHLDSQLLTAKTDYDVVKLENEVKTDGTVITNNIMVIKIKEVKVGTQYSVGIKANADYIEDLAGNNPEEASAIETDGFVEAPKAPAAPEGLIGVAPTSVESNDGKIKGVDDTMEYKLKTDTEYKPVTKNANEITGLSAGIYEVRYAKVGERPASKAVEVTVPEYTKSNVTTLTVKDNQSVVSIEGTVLTVAKDTFTQALVDELVAPAKGNFELQNADGTKATLDTDATKVVDTMKVMVTAEDGTTVEYKITVKTE